MSNYSYNCKSIQEKKEILTLIHSMYPTCVCGGLYGNYLESIDYMILSWEYHFESKHYLVIGYWSKCIGTELDNKHDFLKKVLGDEYNPISPLKIKIKYNFI